MVYLPLDLLMISRSNPSSGGESGRRSLCTYVIETRDLTRCVAALRACMVERERGTWIRPVIWLAVAIDMPQESIQLVIDGRDLCNDSMLAHVIEIQANF